MFNYDCKYSKWYFSIIRHAKAETRKKNTGVYYESHHIIPKCMDGSNRKGNRVLLTAREHFLCHLLLPKMVTTTRHRFQMLNALVRFMSNNGKHDRNFTAAQVAMMREAASNRTKSDPEHMEACRQWGEEYGPLGTVPTIIDDVEYPSRKAACEALGVSKPTLLKMLKHGGKLPPRKTLATHRELWPSFAGENNPRFGKAVKKETRQLISEANKGRLKGENNPMFGKTHNPEAAAKISAARKNRKWMFDPLTSRQKAVDLSEVEVYLSRGWKLGRLRYQKGPGFLLSF